jgi:hypothetical protein
MPFPISESANSILGAQEKRQKAIGRGFWVAWDQKRNRYRAEMPRKLILGGLPKGSKIKPSKTNST